MSAFLFVFRCEPLVTVVAIWKDAMNYLLQKNDLLKWKHSTGRNHCDTTPDLTKIPWKSNGNMHTYEIKTFSFVNSEGIGLVNPVQFIRTLSLYIYIPGVSIKFEPDGWFD